MKQLTITSLRTPRRRSARVARGIAVAAVATVLAAGPAAADNSPAQGAPLGGPSTTIIVEQPGGMAPTTTTILEQPGSTSSTVEGGSGGLAQGYTTLSAALLERYAAQQGTNLSDYLAMNSSQVSSMLGGADLAAASSFDALNATISEKLLGGESSLVGSGFEAMLARVASALGTPDGNTIASGVAYANQLSGLQVPTLSAASLPGGGLGANLAAAGPEQLAFGLFLNSSLANLVQDAPDVFAQVASTGLGTPEAMSAWRDAQTQAGAELNAGLSSGLIAPCQAALMGSMASGNVNSGLALGGDDCRPCAVAGTYMHSHMNRLLAPGAGSLLPVADDGLTSMEWDSLSDWQQRSIEAANPGLRDQIEAARSSGPNGADLGSAQAGCSNASKGTSEFLSSNLSSVFGRLVG